MPKMKNLKVLSLIEFDTFVATHGPGTYVEELAGSKRKLSALSEEPSKQQKFLYLAYFNPVLAHVVAMSDEKLPFVALDSSRCFMWAGNDFDIGRMMTGSNLWDDLDENVY
ncbi:hypothetical protein quinque_015924 [Culex quinquefasciatus]